MCFSCVLMVTFKYIFSNNHSCVTKVQHILGDTKPFGAEGNETDWCAWGRSIFQFVRFSLSFFPPPRGTRFGFVFIFHALLGGWQKCPPTIWAHAHMPGTCPTHARIISETWSNKSRSIAETWLAHAQSIKQDANHQPIRGTAMDYQGFPLDNRCRHTDWISRDSSL